MNPPATHFIRTNVSQPRTRQSQVKKLLENPDRVLWTLDSMTGRSGILVYLIIIAILEALIAEEVDGLVVNTRQMLTRVSFGLDMLQAVCFIPTVREDIEGDLASDRVAERGLARQIKEDGCSRQPIVSELLPQSRHHLFSATSLQIPFLESRPLSVASISPYRTDIDHAVSELDERASHSW